VLRLRRRRGYAQYGRKFPRVFTPTPFALSPSTGSGQATRSAVEGPRLAKDHAHLRPLPFVGEGQEERALSRSTSRNSLTLARCGALINQGPTGRGDWWPTGQEQ